jgi:hypothetical protein
MNNIFLYTALMNGLVAAVLYFQKPLTFASVKQFVSIWLEHPLQLAGLLAEYLRGGLYCWKCYYAEKDIHNWPKTSFRYQIADQSPWLYPI